MQRKKISGYANTRQHLNGSTVSPTGASHTHLHINPKEKKERKSRLPFSASTLSTTASRLSCNVRLSSHVRSSSLAPLVQRELRRHVLSCTPQRARREPHTSTTPSKLSLTPHPQSSALSLHTPSVPRLSPSAFSYSHVRFLARATLSTSSLRAPRPLLGAFPLSANRGRTRCPSPGLSSLWNQADQGDADDGLLPP